MQLPWAKSKVQQLDLVEAVTASVDGAPCPPVIEPSALRIESLNGEGAPLLVAIDALDEDPGNPRTEFPEKELAELAADIALRGILQPIVVHPKVDDGRYQVLFGAKRLRAARRAGLREVPIVFGSQAHDVYAQVAENEKRHGLTPLDLARFMRSRVDAGETNAEVARRLGMDLTTVAHHLALLTLPPELDEALRSGRCTSPRTLYELAKLHRTKPDEVRAIVRGAGEITRRAVASAKRAKRSRQPLGVSGRKTAKPVSTRAPVSLATKANDLCERLEVLLAKMARDATSVTPQELTEVRRRLATLADGGATAAG